VWGISLYEKQRRGLWSWIWGGGEGFRRKSERGGGGRGPEREKERNSMMKKNGKMRRMPRTQCLRRRIMPPAFLAFLEERKTTRDQMKISSLILFRNF
jgi:hypothetical protein